MARVSDLYGERFRSIKTVLFFIVSVSLLSGEAVPTQLVNSIIVCTDGRDIVESADKGMKVFDTGQFDFYFVSVSLFELVVLLSDSFTVVPKSWA